MALRYFEDFVAILGDGTPVELGSCEFTAESIVEFARAYDPQTMHTDPEQARSSIYGGLIASGWQRPRATCGCSLTG
jgi:acyl dehydratase